MRYKIEAAVAPGTMQGKATRKTWICENAVDEADAVKQFKRDFLAPDLANSPDCENYQYTITENP